MKRLLQFIKNIRNETIFKKLLEKKGKSRYNSKYKKGTSVRTKEKMEVKNMATREKNIWVLLVFLLAGLVIGGLLGKLAAGVPWLWWLSYEQEFGLETPFVLDLSVLKITFGLMFKINIASIVGMILSIFIYKKI